jgi:hypothetical protein
MLSLVDNCDKETLCPKCNLRAIYCEADLYKCDCCACDQNLCVPMDHNKVVNPFPQYKEITLDELLVMAKQPIEREVVNG